MVAGLGTGLYLFDKDGCPVNPLDTNNNRFGCNGTAPANNFNLTNVAFDLDKIVLPNGIATSSSNHAMLVPNQTPNRRDGALNPNLAGPLGATLIRRLTDPTTGIVLNSWINADGANGGDAATFVK